MTPMWYHRICRIHRSRTSKFPASTHSVGPRTVNCHFSRSEPGSAIEISFDFEYPIIECGWFFRTERALIMKNGWTRIDSSAIAKLDVFRLIISLDEPRLCEAWLAQANYIFTHLNVISNHEDYVLATDIEYRLSIFGQTDDPMPPGYLFLCPLPDLQSGTTSLEIPDCAAYWSPDPLGVERPSQAEAQKLGFPSLKIDVGFIGHSWSASDYQGLRDFHQGKGFDPYSQDIARCLHLPLFRVPESVNVADTYAEEINNDSDSDLLVTDTMFDDAETLASHRSWDIILTVQFALILTLTAFWLYNYMI
ncbi:hypothetical protein C8R45DRAFT_639929 [Mycena sanguinolenta]|nr:hypothetical protein C8R45DRAFT_639929 [Mycena sanguinolenta]